MYKIFKLIKVIEFKQIKMKIQFIFKQKVLDNFKYYLNFFYFLLNDGVFLFYIYILGEKFHL